MATVAEALNAGLDHHRAGRLANAAAIYRQVLDFDPRQPDALHLLGLTRHQLGDASGAIDLIGQAIGVRADNPAYHVNMGNALFAAGRAVAAIESFRRALALDGENGEAWNSLGLTISAGGDNALASDHFRRAIAAAPNYALAWNNLGVMLDQTGDAGAAADCYRRAAALKLDYTEAHDHLGQMLVTMGRPAEAEHCHRRALALAPDRAIAHSGLGSALAAMGMIDRAIACYRTSLALDPRYAAARTNLGSALHKQRDFGGAIEAHQAAIALEPDLAVAYSNLAAAYTAAGLVDPAVSVCRHLIAFKPGYAQGYNNLGIALSAQGRLDEALVCFRRALAADPDFTIADINLIFTLLYDPDLTPSRFLDEARRFGNRHRTMPRPTFDNRPDPDRRLRIGYLSANFRASPGGRNLEPFYLDRDRAHFEVTSYAQVSAEDEYTRRFCAFSDVWRPIAGFSDDEVARLIRADQIDILVSTSGWLDGNRPQICARRVAPVQVTALDVATSGLAEMDYWLTDGYLHPAGTTDPHTETLVRLPHFTTYVPLEGTPDPGPPPSCARGYVTFGSCNNPAKIRPEVVELWSAILHAVPDARLVLKYINWYGNAEIRNGYLARFAHAGVAAERIVFDAGGGSFNDHLSVVTGFDICLDPFPFNGCTTTFEAMWMGVPVVTLASWRFVGRAAGSLLHAVGLDELIAHDRKSYVAIAVNLAADEGRRAELRRNLRPRMLASPIFDHGGFVRHVEREYRGMWRRWCASHGHR